MEKSANASRTKRILNIVMPLLLTLIALILALEVGLRLMYQLIPLDVCASDPIVGTYYCQPYFEYDKPIRIGYKYAPNFRLEGEWNPASAALANADSSIAPSDRDDSFHYVLEIDEMGFPNGPGGWQDSYDIVVTGDSFTIRTAPVTWIESLGTLTGQDVLTLGAPSWSTLNEVEAIKAFGLDKNPDWVILMFFEGNDLINIGQYVERRDSGLDWREFDMQDVAWWRRSLTIQMARSFLDQRQQEAPAEPQAYRYPVTASTEVGEIDTVFKDVHLLPLSADYDTLAKSDEFAEMKAALLEINELVEAQNGRFLFVYIPTKIHVYWSRIWDETDVNNVLERTVTVTLSEGENGRLQWEPQYISYDQFSTNIQAQEQLLTDFTTEAGIEFLNLTPLFWQETIAHGEFYHYVDVHWNQAGNDLAAQAIFDYMQANP
ncbi:MAG: hypothetical protein KC445_04460 [Anaerolineales bacterium]|nr:hypothetical protein [Anaerolineales bacterium]